MLAYSVEGLGEAAANAQVLQLQQALKTLAAVASYPSADPGETNGIVGQGTVMALAMWASKIPKMPSEVGTILQVAGAGWGFLPDSMKSAATQTVTKFAKELTVGVLAVGAVYTASTSPPPVPSGTPPSNMATAVRFIPGGIKSPAGKYKAGSVARFNTTRNVWSVYSPLSGGYGLGVVSEGRCIGGSCLGEVDPPVPAGFVKTGEEIAPPPDVAQAGSETDSKPFWKSGVFWAVVGGVAVAGGGAVYVMRRRKAA